MRPENRGLLTVVIAVVAVSSVVGTYLLLTPEAVPTALPVPEGAAFSAAQAVNWTVHFMVPSGGGILVGGWTAYDGFGLPSLVVTNGTVSKPNWGSSLRCQLLMRFTESNGTVHMPLASGPYTAYWSTGLCSSASLVVVTQTMDVVPA